MNIKQVNQITLTRLSPEKTSYTKATWDVSLMKKFITTQWPYELYRGSLFNDFLSVFLSRVS